MPFMQWDDSFSVNVMEIDLQHQKIVGMINDLHDAMRQGKGKDVVGRIIAGLLAYAATHFRTEERYFEQFRYPATVSHMREHAEFAKKVADFKKKFDAGALGLSIEVMDFLSNWLQNHIKGADKKYTACFNEHGLS